jgi:hypothetical protein
MEGGDPGVIHVLLSTLRWESWLVKMVGLSGVRRTLAGEHEAGAQRMDRWILWEVEF